MTGNPLYLDAVQVAAFLCGDFDEPMQADRKDTDSYLLFVVVLVRRLLPSGAPRL